MLLKYGVVDTLLQLADDPFIFVHLQAGCRSPPEELR